jgi:arginyl-tRNA synthetase
MFVISTSSSCLKNICQTFFQITDHLRSSKTFALNKLVLQINTFKCVHTESITTCSGSKSTRTQLENYNLDKNELINKVLSPQIRHSSIKKRKILVEFSSPNICKPFHVGHLRSTIIGNFISNLYSYLNNDVIKINYLGDWGTQFGFLNVGLELNKVTEAEIKSNPIQTLYTAYVSANKLAEHDPSIGDKARLAFHQLENGVSEELKKWEKFREYTIDELKTIYERLGVNFNEYHWESMYGRKEISQVIDQMQAQGLIVEQEDGKKVVKVGDRRVPIMKSDGTTLYLTRDVAAMLDRYNKYQFDQIIYVVDHGQSDHFTALFDIVRQLQMPWCDRTQHIKFGRIKGMSTRKGMVVFLRDILDEAKEIMKMKQIQSPSE